MGKKTKRKNSNYMPPKNYKSFFKASSDYDFQKQHPTGYFFLVMLGIVALLAPAGVFCILVQMHSDSWWIILGFLGGFIFGIGLFNFVAIIIKQYLGHLVSIISFVIGGILMLISWFLCN